MRRNHTNVAIKCNILLSLLFTLFLMQTNKHVSRLDNIKENLKKFPLFDILFCILLLFMYFKHILIVCSRTQMQLRRLFSSK